MDVTPTIQHLHGRIRSITGTDPAAGAQISETVPARRRWLLRSLTFSLTTDANAADRRVMIAITDGTNTYFFYPFGTVQTASLTYTYHLTQGLFGEAQMANNIYTPLPTLFITEPYEILSTLSNGQAGDDFTAPIMLVEEWIDP